ncbi:MAG: insulinase family protein [Clostridia bacterium]|nr:insulinase family protein [Clostridia bacterium]
MSVKKINIADGVEGFYIENNRFNTTLITYNFYLPLNSNNMATNSLLPFLLTSCSEQFSDYIQLNIELLDLYGADISCSVSKCADLFHVKIGINVINNNLALLNDAPVSRAAELVSDLIFAPAVCENSFKDADVKREKRKTIERIEGEINNKKSFARTRLMEEMFGSDPYGKFIYGSVNEVDAITGQQLYSAWQELLSLAYVRIIVVGNEEPKDVFTLANKYFSSVNRSFNPEMLIETKYLPETNTPTDITERFSVTQGKIAMGFTSSVKGSLKEAAALSVFSDIFGGGPYSKLFENVREKQSLCYYCSAASRRTKGFVTVQSGVEEKNAQKTIDAVLKELEDMKNGNFEDSVITASKKAITDSLYGYNDNATAIDIWYSREIGEDISPNEAADIVMKVTREDIINAAKGVKLHTVYRLLPKEAE